MHALFRKDVIDENSDLFQENYPLSFFYRKRKELGIDNYLISFR